MLTLSILNHEIGNLSCHFLMLDADTKETTPISLRTLEPVLCLLNFGKACLRFFIPNKDLVHFPFTLEMYKSPPSYSQSALLASPTATAKAHAILFTLWANYLSPVAANAKAISSSLMTPRTSHARSQVVVQDVVNVS